MNFVGFLLVADLASRYGAYMERLNWRQSIRLGLELRFLAIGGGACFAAFLLALALRFEVIRLWI